MRWVCIDVQATYAVLTLPEETVELMACAKIYHHGEIIQVDRKYSLEDIREAFKRAEEDYFAPDVLWMLKEDKGKEHSHRIR